jgi:heme exporter protein C
MTDRILLAAGVASALYLARNLYTMFLVLPDEAAQGAIYRIIFFHIPSWFTCFACFFLSGIASAWAIWKKNDRGDSFAVATTEVGLAFTLIGLATGMIWAKIIWGIWWTWDARLTWAFITALIYGGYLMMRNMIDDPGERRRVTGVLSILAFTSVVITYKAIDWWRTQHPGAILSFRTGGGNTDPAMESMIYHNWFALLLLAAVLIGVRFRQEECRREIDGLRRAAFAR